MSVSCLPVAVLGYTLFTELKFDRRIYTILHIVTVRASQLA